MKTGKDGGAPVDTGPISSLVSWFRSKAGIADPRMVDFKATAGANLADYIKSISGATVGVEERKSLLENVPTAADDDEEFIAKLESVERQLKNKLTTKQKVFKAMKKDTRGILDESTAPADAEFDALPDER
jgi:hypothetical protein